MTKTHPSGPETQTLLTQRTSRLALGFAVLFAFAACAQSADPVEGAATDDLADAPEENGDDGGNVNDGNVNDGNVNDGNSDDCEENGWYGDGLCDADCPLPDPDCEGMTDDGQTDPCEENGWYGDGYCDEECAQPDPDCEGGGSNDPCEENGWYGDGYCDEECPQPDPDCQGAP